MQSHFCTKIFTRKVWQNRTFLPGQLRQNPRLPKIIQWVWCLLWSPRLQAMAEVASHGISRMPHGHKDAWNQTIIPTHLGILPTAKLLSNLDIQKPKRLGFPKDPELEPKTSDAWRATLTPFSKHSHLCGKPRWFWGAPSESPSEQPRAGLDCELLFFFFFSELVLKKSYGCLWWELNRSTAGIPQFHFSHKKQILCSQSRLAHFRQLELLEELISMYPGLRGDWAWDTMGPWEMSARWTHGPRVVSQEAPSWAEHTCKWM